MSDHWPERWRPTRLKFESSLKGRLGWQGLTADEYRDEGPHVVSSAHFESQKIRWDLCPRVSTERYLLDQNIQLAARDILLMKDGAALGKLAYVDSLPGPACLNSHLLLFRPLGEAYDQRFLFHLATTDVFQDYMQVYGTGATFMGVSQRDIGNFPMSLPALSEQVQIARFLDNETARIDALIEQQQQLVALLKEKRQAVVSHAVTKGLNPNAPLRDSGVEWLGMVPAHWEVGRIKNLARLISKGTTPSTVGEDMVAEGVRFIKGENVGKSMSVATSPAFFISKATDQILSRSRLQSGDVLVIIAGATTGLCSVVQDELLPANTNQAVSFVRPVVRQHAFLIAHWLSTDFAQRTIWMGAVQAAQPNLSMEDLGNIPVVVPPNEELERILAYIQDKLTRLDALVARAIAVVELLQERRTALISAAVTGKIDVRGWAPPESKVEQDVA